LGLNPIVRTQATREVFLRLPSASTPEMVFALRFCLYSSAVVGAFGAAHATAREPGNWAGAAADCIKVTPDTKDDWSKHDFTYPSNYANTCDQAAKEPGSYHCTWVTDKKATHAFAVGANYNSLWDSETWCANKFCWVDPCACDKTDISKSSWLNGHYSYSMCGAKDEYTPVSCDANKEEAKCTAVSGCKWDTTCKAQTGAEAMVALRKVMKCTDPDKVPTTCACSANKEPKIACSAANKKLWDGSNRGKWVGAAAKCIKVTPDKDEPWAKHDFTYPANYANTCEQAGKEPGSFHCTWMKGKKATHAFAVGATYNSMWNSEGWCSNKFCWVDPCACDKTDISKSSWLNGHYSYSMCGATDTYTPVACDSNKEEAKCIAATGCKWDTTCKAQTGAEAMVSLRKLMKCTDPEKVPTTCACAANKEPQIDCNADNKKLWGPASTSGDSVSSDATNIKIGTMTALFLFSLAK